MQNKRRRRAVTLIEMVIVMILIATITGVLAVSYRRMLEKGNAFKTEQRMHRLEAIITTYIMENPAILENKSGALDKIETWRPAIDESPLAGEKADDMMRDGWGKLFSISVPSLDVDNWHVSITSDALTKYKGHDPKTTSSPRRY